MLSRSIAHLRTCSQKVDVSQAFDFIPARSCDFNDIVDLCLRGFIRDEPHSRALKVTPEGSRPLIEYIVVKALHYPYSYRIHETGTNNLIGVRLLSITHRDHALDVEPRPFVTPNEAGASRICELLEECKEKLWNAVDPTVQKLLQREITYVSPQHRRKGIANYLIHLGLDFESLKEEGVQGISSVASSLANQKLLSKHGYVCIARPKYELDMYDGNEGMMVFFKDLRK